MRRLWLAACLPLLLTSVLYAAPDLILNGHFATRAPGSDTLPANWQLAAPGRALYEVVNFDGLGDADSLHYRAQASAPSALLTQTITLQKNTDYTLVAALKSDGKLQPVVRIVAAGSGQVLAALTGDLSRGWKASSVGFNSGATEAAVVQLAGDQAMLAGKPAPVGESAIDAIRLTVGRAGTGAAAAQPAFTPPGPNIALGKSYTLSPRPGYSLTADADDAKQLTDGVYSTGYFWAQKSTVGWSGANPVIITLDLGKVEPLAGLSYDTAAGRAQVAWPTAILILVSDDGKQWSSPGDLVQMTTREGGPDPNTYAVHRYATDQVRAHGRFVKLFIEQVPYAFVDEIEVYRGPDTLLTQAPAGQIVADPKVYFDGLRASSAIQFRLRSDLAALRQAIDQSTLSASAKQQLRARAARLGDDVESMPREAPADFKAILPFNDLQTRLYALWAPLHRARGLASLTAWQRSRWEPLLPTDAPAAAPRTLPTVSVRAMQGESRGAAFNLTNASDKPLPVRLSLSGLPGGATPSYLKVQEVLFTDTRERQPIAAALSEIKPQADAYQLSIPAGMTRQIWLTVRPVDMPAKDYQGVITVQSSGLASLKVPFNLGVSAVHFPDWPSVHIGGWDYLNGQGNAEGKPSNMQALLKILPEYFVDTPWGTGAVAPSATFGPAGEVTKVNLERWDEWTGKWPGARQYAVFLSVGDSFQGVKQDDPKFATMVGNWMNAWVEHLKGQGLKPEQLLLLLLDEPTKPDQTRIILNWARAIKAVQPKVTLFEDPTYTDPTKEDPAMFASVDVLCPNLPLFMGSNQAYRDFFVAQQKAGRELYFYSCSGPAKLLDPIAYHRSQFWWALQYGAQGSFYWAFTDEAGASSWQPYLQSRSSYSPLFLDETSATTGKHLEAIREGAEDFETFVMLKQRLADLDRRGVKSPLLDQARALLRSGPEGVTATINAGNLSWVVEKDRDVMDRTRLQALSLLEKISKL